MDDDGAAWLTYRQAAAELGVTPEAVRAMARRKGWPRRSPNAAGGQAWVLLPAGDRRSRPGVTGALTGVTAGRPSVDSLRPPDNDRPGDGDDRPNDRAVEVIAGLLRRLDRADEERCQLQAEAGAQRETLQRRLDLAGAEIAGLRAELAILRARSWWRRLRNR